MKIFPRKSWLIIIPVLILGLGWACGGGNEIPPIAPSNLQATVFSSSQINLAWADNSNNEDGFKIERKTGSEVTYAQIGTAGVGVTSYQDTGLTCETIYYYRVRAYNSAGDSVYSNLASASTQACSGNTPNTPAAPSNLQATAVSTSQINLTWIDNSDNEDGFKIEQKTGAGGTYTLIKTASANTTSYSDTSLSSSTTYYYRIYAYNTTGNSGYSNDANTTTQSSTPLGIASIPAGCFNMGEAFNEGYYYEHPVHNVCISAFKMDVYEVTNVQYKTCVDAGSCTSQGNSSSFSRSSYYGNSAYDNYPVIEVNWRQAKAYCEWTGGRLPTEAEWEYAARGGLSGKTYPWGDDSPICTLGATNGAQYNSCSPGDTIEVGSFAPNGYGLYDMAGNVLEWVNDWNDDNYYSTSPMQDPQGPSSGTYPVSRGGSWYNYIDILRVAHRLSLDLSSQFQTLGFRCAK